MNVIAFDGVCLGDGPTTGVGRAFLDGLHAYAGRADADCVLLVPAGANRPTISGLRCVDAPRGSVRRQRELPRLLRDVGADLLHSSVAAVPLRAPCPTIATVHDLPWLHPEAAERSSWWRRFATRRSLRSATRVIAPSSMSAEDAQRCIGHGGAKVEVVPHGVASPTLPRLDEDRRDGPLLVLGDDRPRKNRARLIAALEEIPRDDRPTLRFVGPPDDYVTEHEKHDLLRTCRGVVHVSRFEGFGLPALEALAHGAPLLCADLPPLREVAGDVAAYVDPDDTRAIAEGLAKVHRDRALRARQVTDGPKRAARFSLQRLADSWLRIHREVLT